MNEFPEPNPRPDRPPPSNLPPTAVGTGDGRGPKDVQLEFALKRYEAKLRQIQNEQEWCVELVGLHAEIVAWRTVVNKFLPNASPKTRHKALAVLESWDVEGRLREIEARAFRPKIPINPVPFAGYQNDLQVRGSEAEKIVNEVRARLLESCLLLRTLLPGEKENARQAKRLAEEAAERILKIPIEDEAAWTHWMLLLQASAKELATRAAELEPRV